MNALEALKGKKTYIVALALIGVVVTEKMLGFDVPGVEVGDDWLNYLLSALGLSALRAGVSKGEVA